MDSEVLQRVGRCLGTRADNILNCYEWGSNLYGTSTRHSDRDFIVVMANWEGEALDTHGPGIDVYAVGLDEFAGQVKEHNMRALTCLWLPEKFIHKEERSCRSYFEYCSCKLRHAVLHDLENDSQRVSKYCSKGLMDRCRRTLGHMHRNLTFALQIAKYGEIVDYHAARDVCLEVDYAPIHTWEDVDAWMKRHIHPLRTEFLNATEN